MKIKDVYTEAMHESLCNAERWLEDAKLLAEHDSNTHAHALQNFALEELAKAVGCWLVVNGFLSHDHRFTDYRKRTSVFGSHMAKNLIVSVLKGLCVRIRQNELIGLEADDLLVEPKDLDLMTFSHGLANIATQKRSEWMYVDITCTDGEYVVLSPLKIRLDSVLSGMDLGKVPVLQENIDKSYAWPFNQILNSGLTDFVEFAKEAEGGYSWNYYVLQWMQKFVDDPSSIIADTFRRELLTYLEEAESRAGRKKNGQRRD